MSIRNVAGMALALLASLVLLVGYPARSSADEAADNAALKDQMRIMMQRIDDLTKQVENMKQQQQQQQAAVLAPAAVPQPVQGPGAAPEVPKVAKAASAETKFDQFMKGFYGTFDVSIDDTTKGIDQKSAYSWGLANPLDPNSGFVRGGNKGPAVGRVGYIWAMSSNGSNIGYRGSHKIAQSDMDFIYQISTSLDMVAAPGLRNTWTKSSNTVQGAIGLGDTYVGFQKKGWGRLRFGEMLGPYAVSSQRLNPFGSSLGGTGIMMGNTGGDNRNEFGTRMDHLMAYDSPVWGGFSFDIAYDFGQQVTYNNVTVPLGSPDCSGSNAPGSGNLFDNCDDGGFDDAWSGDIKFEHGPVYLVAAYELHKKVNRNSDGIGSNNPIYAYLLATHSSLLDFDTYNTFAAENPGAAAATTPPYLTDIADEKAFRFGGQYRFDFGLTVDALFEHMFRSLPAALQFQNERERIGWYFALDQQLNGGNDEFAVNWQHAGRTNGDPGGQHNYNPVLEVAGDNEANSYGFIYRHKFDKQFTWYADAVETISDGNAHYDIGAGGHGIKTDCHDGTNTVFIDYTSAGPTTWGGCHEVGFSTGVTYKF